MQPLTIVTIYMAAGLFAMGLAVALAHAKQRAWLVWGIFCLFFPPLVIILVLLPKRATPALYADASFDIEEPF